MCLHTSVTLLQAGSFHLPWVPSQGSPRERRLCLCLGPAAFAELSLLENTISHVTFPPNPSGSPHLTMPKPQRRAGSECTVSPQGAGGSGGAGPQSTSQSQLAASLQQGLPAAAGGEHPAARPTNTPTPGGSGDPTDGPVRGMDR